MRKVFLYSLLFFSFCVSAQELGVEVLNFKEYLGYVKKYHPVAKQAALTLDVGQAKLLKARGGFDPKIEVDYGTKQFKGTEYYDKLNAVFKIPTWYGVNFKGAFEQNEGVYLNPEATVPEDGLYSAGVSMSIGQGLWINDRMATLKKAKYFREQSKADRDILVNQVLFDAAKAYFDWLQAYNENIIFDSFLSNAGIRLDGVKKSASSGQIAAIDTVEATITLQDRALNLEQAKVRLMQKSLELSSFLWLDNVPIELQENVIPDENVAEDINKTLGINGVRLDSFTIENHPKLKSLTYKMDGLRVDKNLKANKLLPKIEIEYNFLTETPEYLNSLQTDYYKGGIRFQLPLFLRKERGDLKLAKFKLQDAKYELDNAEIVIRNKVIAMYRELASFENQNVLIADMVENYETLLAAEERKFSFGESSLFLINSRENKLIESKLKQNSVQNKFFVTKAKLFNSLAINPEDL
ncbi:TolC family protein [Cellulophaga baltica]|uniref:Outer membrane efflux protein n=1 Tax=Cellulophaga baltica TaxID=76594 RepID=A0A1G7H2Q5_9FLAO|nr:TolC family protein [Cellulophaga baltica]AIY12284.1 transporter [Cellulophaga baltica NN016038]SDE94645.1 Outer membrane efflux protein [Cellulophaga baltica]